MDQSVYLKLFISIYWAKISKFSAFV